MRLGFVLTIGTMGVAFLLLVAGLTAFLQIPFYLVAGWLFFLRDTLPRVTIDSSAITLAVSALLVLVGGIHFAGTRWLRSRPTASTERSTPWKIRWTLALVTCLLLVFTAGISVVGAVHQSVWLGFSSAPITKNSFQGITSRLHSQNNLKQLYLALSNYHDQNKEYPAGGSFDERGRPMHSWVTALLPHMEQAALYESINLSRPWDDRVNRKEMTTQIDSLLQPDSLILPRSNNNDQALTHYSANQRVFPLARSLKQNQVTDGLANTLFIGEVNSDFRPWGDPLNVRDPAIGLNKSASGFGSPRTMSSRDEVLFVLGDASARTVSANVDPKVLKAISTPNGGETVGEF